MRPGHLYVAISHCGVLKIGRTDHPRMRAKTLKQSFKLVGLSFKEVKFCDCLEDVFVAEHALIRTLKGKFKNFCGREWFIGPDYDATFQLAESMTKEQTELEISKNKLRAHLTKKGKK
jgi:hypothetical protein